jgi:hypothetical protein
MSRKAIALELAKAEKISSEESKLQAELLEAKLMVRDAERELSAAREMVRDAEVRLLQAASARMVQQQRLRSELRQSAPPILSDVVRLLRMAARDIANWQPVPPPFERYRSPEESERIDSEYRARIAEEVAVHQARADVADEIEREIESGLCDDMHAWFARARGAMQGSRRVFELEELLSGIH